MELANSLNVRMVQSLRSEAGREKGEEGSDIQDLVMSFSGLEEKVLAQYTFAKVILCLLSGKFDQNSSYELFAETLVFNGEQHLQLNSRENNFVTTIHGITNPLQGVRDATVELLHTLVAVHSEVFAGAKPLLDKTLGILVEGLIDTFLSLFHEKYKSKDLRSLDANGFCQLMLEVKHRLLLSSAAPSCFKSELERTRINTACFIESIPLDSVPESAKAAYAYRGSMDSPRSYMDSPGRNHRGSQCNGFPWFLSPQTSMT
ncbi:hypothetical protein NC651_007538 [Populus alba x Populus x berolinensis]|nr:hypothetical protein NC651_007538 [Populus alba x Populus x berolinensis]